MTLAVFYTPRMVADSRSFSPSAAKPTQVVDSWRAAGLPIAIHEPAPVTVAELSLAHDRSFVEGVLAGQRINGFGNRSLEVAASLPFTSGAMLAAARYALRHRTITSAPCSGFHHASFDEPSGFCTFNGLMVTAAVLHLEGVSRIGILDCDMHDGNGTDAILAHLGAASWVTHVNTGARFSSRSQARPFLAALPETVRALRRCDVVLYQAGADPHVDDPLGGWLTTEELRDRDRIVFTGLAALGIPVAWNLAGGYQQEPDGSIPKVLAIHRNTAEEALRVLARGRGARAGQTRA